MTTMELVVKMANRTRELADLPMPQLRMEHPDSADTEVPSANNAREVTKGKTRGELISDILIEEFSDAEVDS